MGIFSKIFHKDELKLHDEEVISKDEESEIYENKNPKKQNTQPSPFLVDEQNDAEIDNK